jgi:hypothetical protein
MIVEGARQPPSLSPIRPEGAAGRGPGETLGSSAGRWARLRGAQALRLWIGNNPTMLGIGGAASFATLSALGALLT